VNRSEVEEVEDKEKKQLPALYFFDKSTLAWLTIGLLIGSFVRGPWTQDVLELLRGYRWNPLERCIVESPDTSGNGVDFCRLPVDCKAVCSQVSSIDEFHVDDLSMELFEERYAHSERPLVVRNVSHNWKAMRVLDYHWLKDQYHMRPAEMDRVDKQCWFNSYSSLGVDNLRSLFRLPEKRLRQKGKPWYVGWGVCHEPIASEILNLFEPPPFLHPDSTPPKRPWIFIGQTVLAYYALSIWFVQKSAIAKKSAIAGTPGDEAAHIHIDNLGLPSWQAQISGVKTWYLRPPPECASSCHPTMQATLYPGDLIIVNTRLWFHGTKVHKPDISLSLVAEFD